MWDWRNMAAFFGRQRRSCPWDVSGTAAHLHGAELHYQTAHGPAWLCFWKRAAMFF